MLSVADWGTVLTSAEIAILVAGKLDAEGKVFPRQCVCLAGVKSFPSDCRRSAMKTNEDELSEKLVFIVELKRSVQFDVARNWHGSGRNRFELRANKNGNLSLIECKLNFF